MFERTNISHSSWIPTINLQCSTQFHPTLIHHSIQTIHHHRRPTVTAVAHRHIRILLIQRQCHLRSIIRQRPTFHFPNR